MDSKEIGALAGLVGFLGYLVSYGLGAGSYIGRWIDGAVDGVHPTFGDPSTTTTVFSQIIGIVEPLVLVTLGIGLGYYVAQRVTIDTEYRRVLGSIAVGTSIGVEVGMLTLIPLFYSGRPPDTDVWGFLLFALHIVDEGILGVALLITVSAIAGAAITHFRLEGSPPAGPAETATEAPTDAASTIRSDDDSFDSRTTP